LGFQSGLSTLYVDSESVISVRTERDPAMSTPVKPAKVTLVTVITGFEMKERVISDLTGLGVTGCTIVRAEGHGLHGTRRFGVLDGANVQIEILVDAELAKKILELVETGYRGEPILAFAHEVHAVSFERFA
jgi:nitrogen regulatory protein PII